ncbi:caspase family protein [Spirosoma sp. HMF3257]|uniref:Caspase family protein n=1 Tax=Spirosoma telluris TaxID=2183553 RepID=A0A327NWA5_9BACT|nr:caspase family protein [Spirosoma telluris]RAI77128.1 caspase family protein [Spirosoma telluris]
MLLSLLLYLHTLISPPTTALSQRTFAVVIGVSDYKLGLPGKGDLKYSDDDARSFYQLLTSRAGGSVPSENIRLLIDGDASLANILQAMTIFQNATPNDRIVFFFSGHGDKGIFLPYDAYVEGPDVVLQHADVKAAFHKSQAGTKFLLADACKSGSMVKRVETRALHPKDSTNTAYSTAVHTPTSTSSTVVIMLSSYDYLDSQEDSRLEGGDFTHYLIAGVKGAADTNHDGIVTIIELHYYISLKVRVATVRQLQEDSKLKGGNFAYYLIAGARGAADVNHDGRATVEELNEYIKRKVLKETKGKALQGTEVVGNFNEDLPFTP